MVSEDDYQRFIDTLFKVADLQPNAEALGAATLALRANVDTPAGVIDRSAFTATHLVAARIMVSQMLSLDFTLRVAGYERFVDLALRTLLCARIAPSMPTNFAQEKSSVTDGKA